jgi:hypothetical protein
MFFIDFRDFLNNSRYFVFNSAEQEPCFVYLWVWGTFHTSNESKLFTMSFFREKNIVIRRSQRGMPSGRKEGTTRSHFKTKWCGPSPPMDAFLAFFASTESSWPKTDYIYNPSVYFARGGREIENTQHRSVDYEIGGETMLDSLPVAHSPLSMSSHSPPW